MAWPNHEYLDIQYKNATSNRIIGYPHIYGFMTFLGRTQTIEYSHVDYIWIIESIFVNLGLHIHSTFMRYESKLGGG